MGIMLGTRGMRAVAEDAERHHDGAIAYGRSCKGLCGSPLAQLARRHIDRGCQTRECPTNLRGVLQVGHMIDGDNHFLSAHVWCDGDIARHVGIQQEGVALCSTQRIGLENDRFVLGASGTRHRIATRDGSHLRALLDARTAGVSLQCRTALHAPIEDGLRIVVIRHSTIAACHQTGGTSVAAHKVVALRIASLLGVVEQHRHAFGIHIRRLLPVETDMDARTLGVVVAQLLVVARCKK